MYKALYRKWRPKVFGDVVGQDHVTETLKREIKTDRISHAYLFTGTRGTGKTSCAKIFAKAVNCLSPVDGEPCRKCEICVEAENDTLLDIVEIDAASNNGVENIRSMREEVVFSPAKCKYRVYIVDEVHMLSTGAFNAFLKILEEPPQHVIFILATTEAHKIPPTILSRCQRFDFYRIKTEDICKRLEYICKEEKIKITDPALKLIASAADGGMRDALSILDQCANICKDDITENSVKQLLGITGLEYIKELANLINQKNCSECLKFIEKMHFQSKNMLRLCEELMMYFRDLMLQKVSGSEENLNLQSIINSLDILQESYKNINAGSNAKMEMEIAVVKLGSLDDNFSNGNGKPYEEIEKSPERIVKISHGEKEAEKVKEESFPKVSESEIISNSETDKNAFELWPKILEELSKEKASKTLYIALKDSKAYKNKNYILIDSDKAIAFEYLRNSEHRTSLKNIILNLTGKHYNLGPYNKDKKEESLDPLDALISVANQNNIKTK